MSTENKRIQQRHSTYSDLQSNINSIYDDELVIVDSGHPDTTDGSAMYYKPIGLQPKRLQNAGDPVNIPDLSVGSAKLADGAVISDKLAVVSVHTTHIADGNVTEAKLDSNVVNKLNDVTNKMYFVPVVSSLSQAASFPEGQLFVYRFELLRKTANSYIYLNQIGSTGGTISGMTPSYVGQFYFINGKLYVGKTTDQGGFIEVDTDNLKVKLSQTSDGFSANKTNKEIYDACVGGKTATIYSGSVDYGDYNYWTVDRVFTQSVAGGTLYGAIIHNMFGAYRTLGEANSFSYFTEYEV